jgi:hypothetical protein
MWRQEAERELEKASFDYLFVAFAKSYEGRHATIVAAGERVMRWRKELDQAVKKELGHEGYVGTVRSTATVQSETVTDDSLVTHSARMTQRCNLLTP